MSASHRNDFRFLTGGLAGILFVALILSGLFSSCDACRDGKDARPQETAAASPSGSISPPRGVPAPSPGSRDFAPVPVEPDSSQLLAADLESGAITLDEAARYRILRLFRPDLVPEKYRYPEAPASGTWDVLQVTNRFFELSPETAAELTPYLVQPTDPRSIHYKRLHRQTPSAAVRRFSLGNPLYAEESGPVREIYQTDTGYTIEVFAQRPLAAAARKARVLIEEYKMYEKFERLLGRKTLDSGGGRLMIYILSSLEEHEDEAGNRFEPMGTCISDYDRPDSRYESGTSSAWIQISAGQIGADPYLAATLAHEMFHAFQFAFSLDEEKWLDEGTAVWAEDFIGPDWNTEQRWLDRYSFRGPVHNRLREQSSMTAYGMYLFFKYLTQTRSGGNESVMRRIWETCAANRGASFPSVKKAAGGDFDDLFREYAFTTLDKGEAKGKFRDTVGRYGGQAPLPLSDIHGFRGLWHIDENGTILLRSGIQIQGTGISYYQVTNGAQGTMAPTVRFDLSEFQGRRELGIQAVIEDQSGGMVREDWSDLEERIFCLALDSQNFQSIYLAVSSTKDDPEPELLLLDLLPASDRECLAGRMEVSFSEESNETYRMTKKWGGVTTNEEWDRQRRHKIDLTLDLVPKGYNTKADAAQAAARLPGEIRERALAEMLRPEAGDFDENTGCLVYPFRVKAARINGFSRNSSLSGSDVTTDYDGVQNEGRRQIDEHWSKSDLSEDTQDDLKDESVTVRVYVEPGSGTIKWVYIGSIGIEAQGQSRRISSSRLRYQPDPDWNRFKFRDRKDDQTEDLEETFGFGVVSDSDKDMPMNPDWKAQSPGRRRAGGGGRIEKPLEETGRGDEGMSWKRSGREIKEFKWRLILDIDPKR